MKISYNWLKDYVDVKLDPEKLANILTMAGLSVTSLDKVGSDYIFELEITSNRADCLSLIGVAREAAAILGKKLKTPKKLEKSNIVTKKSTSLDILIKDTELCFRYTGRVIKNAEVGPSPDWLREKILSVGLRPVNNIVDVTNFVLFETGQPMHAFDLDKLKGNIETRRAKKGERIITIDNVPRTCEDNMLVIADDRGPIAIAGVMGGAETEVNNMTKNILLESAFFNPISIRKTSRNLGLTSESSYRFERKIDNNMVAKASERAAGLIEELAGGKKEAFYDVGKKTIYSKTIKLNTKKVDSILGVSVGKSKATKILQSLGFLVKDTKKTLHVTVPSFREDVKTDVDIVEEIARIYGYDNIPLTIPRITENAKVKDFTDLVLEKISNMLTHFGLEEIITYSLISKDSIKELDITENEVIAINNPLSIDQEIMRPTLLSGMLKAMSYNFNRKAERLSLFEIGKSYKEKNNNYIEEFVLSIGLAGIKEENWKTTKVNFDFFNLKGILEKLLSEIGIEGIIFTSENKAYLDASSSAFIEYRGGKIASLGEVDKKVLDKFGIEKRVFYGELNINKIMKNISLDKHYNPISKYPSIMRDISVLLDKSISSDKVENIIKEVGKDLVKNVILADEYRGKQIPSEKRGLLYRIEYRSDKKTLEDSEVDKLQEKIKQELSDKITLSFR